MHEVSGYLNVRVNKYLLVAEFGVDFGCRR